MSLCLLRKRDTRTKLLGDVRIGRRKEIRSLPEFRVALCAQPVVAIGVAGSVVGVVLRLEKFPAADEAVIFLPAAFDEFEVFCVLCEAQVEGKLCRSFSRLRCRDLSMRACPSASYTYGSAGRRRGYVRHFDGTPWITIAPPERSRSYECEWFRRFRASTASRTNRRVGAECWRRRLLLPADSSAAKQSSSSSSPRNRCSVPMCLW